MEGEPTGSGLPEKIWVNGEEATAEPGRSPSLTLSGERGLEKFRELPVTFKVQIGHTKSTLKQWLEIGIGSRISLEESWRHPVHLFINDRRVGSGTIVLVGNRFGVRVTEWGGEQE